MTRLLLLAAIFLSGCGPSQEEKKAVAAVTCAVMAETRNMDAAIRVEKMNEAREKVGGEPFLDGDDKIKESLEFGLCQELVLNEFYSEELQSTKDAIRKTEQIQAKILAEAIKAEAKVREAEAKAHEAKLEAERLKARVVHRKKVEKFLPGATFTKSGLAYQIMEEGSGPKPSIDNTVEVHYVGRFLDGTEFDSSVKRGASAQFGVTQVIPGWTEVLQLMPEGSKWKVYVRSGLAYGASGTGPIGPNEDLLFDIELIRSNVD